MNKRHISQLRKRTREEAQPFQTFSGCVTDVAFCNRKINRARRAALILDFTRADNKGYKLLVPSTLRSRCISEIVYDASLNVTVQAMSPDGGYRRADNEFELKDFKVKKVGF